MALQTEKQSKSKSPHNLKDTQVPSFKLKGAHHGSADDYKSNRPIGWSVEHADGSLVLRQHIGKGGVDGDGVHSVEAPRHISDAGQGGACQEMEPVVVLHSMHTGVGDFVGGEGGMGEWDGWMGRWVGEWMED